MELDELLQIVKSNPEAATKLLKENPRPLVNQMLSKIGGMPSSPEALLNQIREYGDTPEGKILFSKLGISKETLGASTINGYYNFLKPFAEKS